MKRYPLMLKALLILGLCMLASACASPNMCWYKDKTTDHQIKTDRFQCEEAAVTYSNDMGASGNLGLITLRMIACMKDSRGYQLVSESTLPATNTCIQ